MLDKTTATVMTTTAPVGFRLVSSEVKDLTPDVVKEFRALEATSTERGLNETRVTHLDDKATRGVLVTFHWITASLGGKKRRVNGQHSSVMLDRRRLKDDGSFPPGLKVHFEHFDCDDGDALALLFRQFDDRKSGRSPLDISGVYQGLHPELDGINRKIGKLVVDGYSWYRSCVEKVPAPKGDDVYGTFNDTGLWPLMKWINDLFSVKSNEMKYQAIVAAIVGTYMTNESAARDFWQDVVNLPNGDDEATPASVLSNWLINIQAKKVERPEAAHLYQGCIYAWNAYRSDKAITAIRDDIKKHFLPIHE